MQRSLLINPQGLLQDGSLSAGENLIINGNFQVAQRGTSFSAIASGAYSLDRWKYFSSATGGHNISQDADIPTVAQAGIYAGKSILVSVATAQASLTAGANNSLSQNIEGFIFQKIAQIPFTLSFWVKATKTGIYSVAFRNKGLDQSYVAEYIISAANTWEKKTIYVPASPTSGTWDYTNGYGLSVLWNLGAGTTYQVAAGSWASGNYYATSNTINACDAVGNQFRLALVKIEPGTVASLFAPRDMQTVLNLCYRYYYRGYLSAVSYSPIAVSNHASPITLPATMRSTPTAALITAGGRVNVDTSSAPPSCTMANARDGRFQIQSVAAGNFWAINDLWEFNAEL